MGRFFAGAAIMVAGAALTACSSFDNAVSVRAAQPDGRKIAIAWQPREPVGLAQWPNACDFLSDKEIKAFAPEATAFRRTSEWVTSPGGRAENGKCEYEFKLPSPSGRPFPSTIPLSIDYVADPALVTKAYAGTRKSRSVHHVVQDMHAPGADACFGSRTAKNDVPEVTCRKGPLMFTLRLRTWYANFDGVTRDDEPAKNRIIEERVIPAIVETVAAKV